MAMISDNLKITYIPINYYKRTSDDSKISAWDFVNFVTLVLRLAVLFEPLKIFTPIALISFLLGGFKFLFKKNLGRALDCAGQDGSDDGSLWRGPAD